MNRQSPNVLHIISDQHNAKILGHADHPEANTPNLDRLAAEGVRFVFYPVSMFSEEHPRGFCELYDLEIDPWEITNLALGGAHDGIVADVKVNPKRFADLRTINYL